MVTVCQKCGDEGQSKSLVFCIKCHTLAEHRYCLDKLPKDDNEKVLWTCYDCTPKEDVKPGPSLFRQSKRSISVKELAAARMKNLRDVASIKGKRAHSDISNQNEKIPRVVSGSDDCYNKESETKRRLLILPEEVSSVEKPCSVLVKLTTPQSTPDFHNDSSLNFDNTLALACMDQYTPDFDLSPNSDNKLALECMDQSTPDFHYDSSLNFDNKLTLEGMNEFSAEPVEDRVWRGCFNIRNLKNGITVKLAAHLSNKACEKAAVAVNKFPAVLDLEIIPKADALPKRFINEMPLDNSIALYFLPEFERDENNFDVLLDDMLDGDLALRTVIDDVHLLIFTSRELPSDQWRIGTKYYLWALFHKKKGIRHRGSG